MTTITVSKEMLGRTLEALESCDAGDWSTGHVIPASYNERAVEDAINDLRAALSAPANAPEQMPSERNCVCDSYVHLDGYSGGAAKEGLYGALWVVAEGVRKKYVLAPEQSRGTAQEQPSWQDAPTEPGMWACLYMGELSTAIFNAYEIEHFDRDEMVGCRWRFIPEDK